MEKIPFKKRVLKFLSDTLSWCFGKLKVDNLGNCSECGCSVYYKSREIEEKCPKNKWEK